MFLMTSTSIVKSSNFKTLYRSLDKALGSGSTVDKKLPFGEAAYRTPEYFLSLGPSSRYFYRSSCDGDPPKLCRLRPSGDDPVATRAWFDHGENALVQKAKNGHPFYEVMAFKYTSTRLASTPGIEAMAKFLNESAGKAKLVVSTSFLIPKTLIAGSLTRGLGVSFRR